MFGKTKNRNNRKSGSKANKTDSRFLKQAVRNLEAEAFFAGTQPNVTQAEALKETAADFEKMREGVKLRCVDEIKTLEADVEIARQRQADAEDRWQRMNTLSGGREPELTKPALAVLVSALLIVAEGLLLAPVMDVLTLTDPAAQWAFATGMVIALSGILKWSVHNFRQTPRSLWLVVVPAAFALLALAVFGWWRGEAVVFVTTHSADGNTFAAENAFLTKLLLTLVTIALPTLAAVALEFGLEKLRFWQEHHAARKDFRRFSKELESNQKKLEAARERRDKELEMLAQEREAWLAAAKNAFGQGREIGAHKKPRRDVLLPIVVFAILAFVVVMLLAFIFVNPWLAQFIESEAFRFALFLLTVVGLTGLFAVRVFRKWHRPTAEELFVQRVSHWRNAEHPDSHRVNEGMQTHNHLPAGAGEEGWEDERFVTTR